MTKRDIGDYTTSADDDGQAYTTQIRNSLKALWDLNGGVVTNVAGTNAVTGNLPISDGFTAYSNGLKCSITPVKTNTGAVTLNLNGLGAKPLRQPNGDPLSAAEFVAGTKYEVEFDAGSDLFRLNLSSGQSNISVQGGIHLFRSLPTRLGATVAESTTLQNLVSRTVQAQYDTSRIILEGQICRRHASGSDNDAGLVIALFVDETQVEVLTDGEGSEATQASSFSFEYEPGDTDAHVYSIRATSTIGATYLPSSTWIVLRELSPNP